MNKKLILLVMSVLVVLPLCQKPVLAKKKTLENRIVVIDPGHGAYQ